MALPAKTDDLKCSPTLLAVISFLSLDLTLSPSRKKTQWYIGVPVKVFSFIFLIFRCD